VLRLFPSLFGDGFVEALGRQALLDLAQHQSTARHHRICGQALAAFPVRKRRARRRRPLLVKISQASLLVFGKCLPERDGDQRCGAAA